ncbi:hypothetical protein MVEN_00003900 [Mycena venus]|uniref:DUF6532 domain-containing protein n=1 Tax=Mycena venus TaxID=2733690 RepID=A0A8H6Z2N1_9AGAR|nr:hypothetical protein MVEN_00003900 [Mycena venus]
MTYIDFAAQEPVKYGRQHRKSRPTARIETHNQIQAEKENRRKARDARKDENVPQPSQYPKPKPLKTRPQPHGSASAVPLPQVLENTSMDPSRAAMVQAGGLRMPTASDHAPYRTSQLEPELEPRSDFVNSGFGPIDEAERLEMEQDPGADDSGSDDDDGHSRAINIDEGLSAILPGNDEITSTPVNLPGTQRTLVRRIVNHASGTISTPSPVIAYHTPTGPTVPYATNPRRLVRRAHVVNDLMSSSPTPAQKRPFSEVEGGRDERDDSEHGDDSDDDHDSISVTPAGPVSTSGPLRASDLPPARRRIFDRAVGHFHLLVLTQAPYGKDPIEVDKLAVTAWYSGLEELHKTHGYQGTTTPSFQELNLLKKRIHQVKGTTKTLAGEVVLSNKGYPFKQENTPEGIAHNRQLVTSLLTNHAFLSRDPNNRNLPGTLFEHSALQELLNRVCYGDESDSVAVLIPKYFENGLPEKTLAYFATALHSIITEFQTGVRVKARMTAKTWRPVYEKHLRTIEDWKVYTTNSGSHLTQKLQIRMIQNARRFANVDVTPDGDEPVAISVSDFAANEA